MKEKQPKRADEGTAAVEFALVLPILVLLIFGIVDFGRMLSAKITLAQAAREGARAAALVSTDEGVARVYAASAGLGEHAVTPEITGCADDPSANATARVTYRFIFVTPVGLLFGPSGDGHLDLSAESVMPCLS